MLVGRQRQELDKRIAGDQFIEQCGCCGKLATLIAFGTNSGLDFIQFLVDHLAHQFKRDRAAIIEDAFGVANPLPDLGARNLGGGGVFHQVENWHGALAAQPGLDILNAHIDVSTQPWGGDRAAHKIEQVAATHLHILACSLDLVGLRHHAVEDFERNRHETGMGNPCAVVAVGRFTFLVGAHLGKGAFVGGFVVLYRDEGRHAADGVDVAAVACFDRQQRVRAHEVGRHRDLGAVGEDEIGFAVQLLDARKDVVPAATV